MNRIERIAYTRVELLAQAEAIRETLEQERETMLHLARDCQQQGFQRVHLVGSGDSFSVAEAVATPWHRWLQLPVQAFQALEHVYEQLDRHTLVVAISAMGGSGATLDAATRARDAGAFVLCVTNAPSSALVQPASAVLPIHATRIGWPTQSTTAQIAALLYLGLAWADSQLPSAERESLRLALLQLPEVVGQVLQAQDRPMKQLAEQWKDHDTFFFAGSGPAYTAARLGSSKIKEMSQDHAYAMYLEEYHHFYSVKSGEAFFLVAPPGPARRRAVDTARTATSVGARVVVLQDGTDTAIEEGCPRIDLPSIPLEITSIVYAVPLQLFAQHLGVLKQRPEWALQDHAGRPLALGRTASA